MEHLLEILMVFLPTVAAAIWAWFKRKNWLNVKGHEALEAGVITAWESYGRERKQKILESPGSNKFTKDDRLKLKTIAKETAIKLLASQKISLTKTVGSEELQNLAIEKIVAGFRRG